MAYDREENRKRIRKYFEDIIAKYGKEDIDAIADRITEKYKHKIGLTPAEYSAFKEMLANQSPDYTSHSFEEGVIENRLPIHKICSEVEPQTKIYEVEVIATFEEIYDEESLELEIIG